MIRSLAAVVAGLVAAFAVMTVVEAVGHTIYPPPPDLDPLTPEGMAAIVAHLPTGALLFVLAAYVCGGLAGGAVAGRVARGRPVEPALVGTVLTLGALVNVITIPHPLWMSAASVAVQLPAAWLGGRLVSRP
ncbi:MAG TPA: hypothetical protein VMM93_04865, partial [Vicinamibacterales bacterium]|nr:hypothetical protein [Vicinamibacterales bacterium]